MPVKKYTDFIESNPVLRRGKLPPYEARYYVTITCPHCKQICSEITQETVKATKASTCLKHLRICPDFDGNVTPRRSFAYVATSEPKEPNEDSIAELKAQMAAMKEDNEAQMAGMQAQLKDLQQHKNMINNVLIAVAPSIRDMLPLEGPEQKAQRTLTNAMIQDFPRLMPPGQVIVMKEDSSLPANLMYRAEYEEQMRAHAVRLECSEEQLKRTKNEIMDLDGKIQRYKRTIEHNEDEIRRLKVDRDSAMEMVQKAETRRVVLENEKASIETKYKLELEKKREREKMSKQAQKLKPLTHGQLMIDSLEQAQKRARM